MPQVEHINVLTYFDEKRVRVCKLKKSLAVEVEVSSDELSGYDELLYTFAPDINVWGKGPTITQAVYDLICTAKDLLHEYTEDIDKLHYTSKASLEKLSEYFMENE